MDTITIADAHQPPPSVKREREALPAPRLDHLLRTAGMPVDVLFDGEAEGCPCCLPALGRAA